MNAEDKDCFQENNTKRKYIKKTNTWELTEKYYVFPYLHINDSITMSNGSHFIQSAS